MNPTKSYVTTLSPLFLALILTVATAFPSHSQGPQQVISIPYTCPNCTSPNLQGYIYLPGDYTTSTTHYPVLFFNNGTMLPATLSSELGQALPSMIASGMRPDNIINPADGKKYSFIVVSLINNPYPAIPMELRWLSTHYRIDNSRVYITGLSQGGLATLMAATADDSISKLITAVLPMSTPNVPTSMFNFGLLNTHKIKTWFFAGNSDAFTPNGTDLYFTLSNSAYPGGTTKTIYNGGHCCWNTFYSTTYKDPTLNMSIYQWMLTQSNATKFPILPVRIKTIKLNRKQ